MRNLGNRRGDALIEFTLLGIPVIFVTISLVTVSLDMWQFHELPYAVEMTARYAATHGQGCASTCSVSIGNLATYFQSQNIALLPSQVNVTLTDGGGSTSCSPLTNCSSNATVFPRAANNAPGSDITVYATYVLKNPIAMFWPPNEDGSRDFTVSATSRQRITY
jgi:Flp pilus assembly protein TadG